MLMSTRVLRALAAGTEFQTQLINGGARPASRTDLDAIIAGAGLPPIYVYDRRVSVGGTANKVIPDDRLLLLPAPVDPGGSAALRPTSRGEDPTANAGRAEG